MQGLALHGTNNAFKDAWLGAIFNRAVFPGMGKEFAKADGVAVLARHVYYEWHIRVIF